MSCLRVHNPNPLSVFLIFIVLLYNPFGLFVKSDLALNLSKKLNNGLIIVVVNPRVFQGAQRESVDHTTKTISDHPL